MRVITIGREQGSNDIVVNDPKISRNHLQLVVDDNGNVTAADMGSTNGTFVNGVRIVGEQSLCAGDQLRVGDSVLPWESYITTPTLNPPAYVPPFPQSPYQGAEIDYPRRHTGLIIALSIVGALLVGLIVWLLMAPRQEKLHPSQTHYLSNDSSQSLNPNDTAWDSERALREYKDRWLNSFENNTKHPAKKVDNEKAKKEAEAVKLREEGYSSEDIEKILAGEPKSKFKTRKQKEEEEKARREQEDKAKNNKKSKKDSVRNEDTKQKGAIHEIVDPRRFDNKDKYKVDKKIDNRAL